MVARSLSPRHTSDERERFRVVHPLHIESYLRPLAIALAALATLSAVAEQGPAIPAASDNELFRPRSAEEFRKLEAPQQGIDVENFREELLAAAIFHETNGRRLKQQLPALALQAEVRAASLKHAQLMAEGRFLSHGTPSQPQNTTPHDRLVQEGLQPRYCTENIAVNFVLQIEPGKPFYTRNENGRSVHSYEANGAPIAPHTYLSLAEAFVTQWMNSPLHRQNILATEAESMGVGCALSKDEKGRDTVYVNQNFFAPMPAPPVPQP